MKKKMKKKNERGGGGGGRGRKEKLADKPLNFENRSPNQTILCRLKVCFILRSCMVRDTHVVVVV